MTRGDVVGVLLMMSVLWVLLTLGATLLGFREARDRFIGYAALCNAACIVAIIIFELLKKWR